jgi:hypothetical protein
MLFLVEMSLENWEQVGVVCVGLHHPQSCNAQGAPLSNSMNFGGMSMKMEDHLMRMGCPMLICRSIFRKLILASRLQIQKKDRPLFMAIHKVSEFP